MRTTRSSWMWGLAAGSLVLAVGFTGGRASVDRSTGVLSDAGDHAAIVRAQGGERPCPRDTVAGRRTRDAAVTAATAYAVALDGPSLLDPEQRRQLIEEIGATDARDDLDDSLGRVAFLLVERLGLTTEVLRDDSFVWRAVPAGWRVVGYDGSRAEVAIWATGVAMVHGRPLAPQAWRTTFVELVWERGGWRLADLRSEAGPEPASFRAGSRGRAVAREIRRFEPFAFQPRTKDRS